MGLPWTLLQQKNNHGELMLGVLNWHGRKKHTPAQYSLNFPRAAVQQVKLDRFLISISLTVRHAGSDLQ